MPARSDTVRASQLWQLPLLLFSLLVFGYAAYLFVDPKPGLTIDDRIAIASLLLERNRPEAAIEHLNKLLITEKLEPAKRGRIHLLLAGALEAAQKEKRLNVPANHQRIIEQTRLAMGDGEKPTGDMYRRMGSSFEALNRSAEALDNYRQAATLDPQLAISLQRKIIDLQLGQDDTIGAEVSLEAYAKMPDISDAERAWALGERAQILTDRGQFTSARTLLDEALKISIDPVQLGEVNFRQGYASWKTGAIDDAERYLRVAREQLRVQHPIDAEACYVLGRIYQEKNEPAQAISFYQIVLTSHPGSKVSPLALLGRGLCRIMTSDDDAGLSDLHDLTNQVLEKSSRARYREPVVEGLQRGAKLLEVKGKYAGAIELLAYEQSLVGEPKGNFFARLGSVFEKRSDQIASTIPDITDEAERIRRGQQVRDLRAKSGDAFIAYSRALTLADDGGYGDALWRGVQLYDRAGDVQRVISALELFVAERPEDALASDALLRLGRAYQASGLFDKAITAFQRNQFRYPKSLAASKSAVPLAQAYIAKGTDFHAKAERTLLSVIDNNPLLTPESEEFKLALFELAQLFYRSGRYEESVAKLEELTQRYPNEERFGQLLFLMGDSYRKSANLLDVKLAALNAGEVSPGQPVTGAGEAIEANAAKKERLTKAKALYDRVIELYRTSPPASDTDKLYMRLAHFYRADCMYDLGNYEEAVRLYDAAAFRYQEDPSSLSAYVQIVNSYFALGKVEEAKTANERAKWLLKRMPQEAFSDGSFSMPKNYWEQWLKWTSEAGMW